MADFKVKFLSNWLPRAKKGDVFSFVNGRTQFANGQVSGFYDSFTDFQSHNVDAEIELALELPRICYILGGEKTPLQIGEIFKISGVSNNPYHFCNDMSHLYDSDGANEDFYVPFIINHPEKIIRQSQFNETEIEKLKALKTLGFKYVERDKDGNIYAHENGHSPIKQATYWAINGKYIRLNSSDFPQVKWSDAELLDIAKALEG